VDVDQLPPTVPGMIESFLHVLEQTHGKLLVARALVSDSRQALKKKKKKNPKE
jgi:hypothetical protein